MPGHPPAIYPWLITAVTDANNLTTRYKYDAWGRLQTVIGPTASDASPSLTYTYTLNVPVLITETAWLNEGNSLRRQTQTTYDGLGRAIESRAVNVPRDDSSGYVDIVTVTAYDGLGRAACQSEPTALTVSAAAPACTSLSHTTTTYDALGRVRFVTAPDGSQTEHRYSINNNLGPIRLHHNVINPNWQRTRYTYNALNQLVQVTEYSGNCGAYWGYNCGSGKTEWAEYASTTYTYDAVGNLTQVTDANNHVTTMSYDLLGRKTGMTDPDMGTWTYAYDPAGNLVQQTDANGVTLCFTYDALNRLLTKGQGMGGTQTSCATTTALATYTYDTAVNGIGLPAQITWPGGSDTFTYDAFGRLSQQTRTIDGRPYTQSFTYDKAGRPLTRTYPNGQTATTTYDYWGENKLTDTGGVIVSNIAHNERGQLTALTRGSGQTTTYDYFNATGSFRLEAIRHGAANDTLPDFTYTYDPLGNILQMVTQTSAGTDTQTFTYDHLNRLLTASATGGVANYNETYSYDKIGNITSMNGAAYTYSATQPHAVTSISNGQSFSYDANGNMTTRNDSYGSFSQTWDAENRLVSVTETGSGQTTTFAYDPNGQRIKTVKPDGTTIYTPFPDYEEEHRWLDPTLTFTANGQTSLTIANNTSFTLTWQAQYSTNCTASGSWSGSKAPQGSQTMTGFANSSRTYTLTCTNPKGTVSQSVTVTAAAKPTVSLTANNQSGTVTISPRTSFTLRWSSTNATTCTASGSWSGSKPLSGSQTMSGFIGERTYTLTCTNAAGSTSRSVTVQAGLIIGPPPPCRRICLSTYPPTPKQQKMIRANKITAAPQSAEPPVYITRITYAIAGQTVAVRISGDPDPANNGLHYLYTDHLGSVSAIRQANGAVQHTRYLPFGGYRAGSGPNPLANHAYTSQRENMEIGLYYYNARYYAPYLNRFISADTLVPDPANPQSFNRYSYVENRPLNFNDPTGHIACEVLGTEECDENGDYTETEMPTFEKDNPTPFLGAIPPWWNEKQIQQLRNGTLSNVDKAEMMRYGGVLHTYVQLWFIEAIRPTAQMEVYIPFENNGYGYADLVDGIEIWEVKPISVYGYRDAALAQLGQYVAHYPGGQLGSFIPQLMGNGSVLQHPLVPHSRELVVKMDPDLPGIIIYYERNKTNNQVYQPNFEFNHEFVQNALFWTATLAGWTALQGGKGGNIQPELVK